MTTRYGFVFDESDREVVTIIKLRLKIATPGSRPTISDAIRFALHTVAATLDKTVEMADRHG